MKNFLLLLLATIFFSCGYNTKVKTHFDGDDDTFSVIAYVYDGCDIVGSKYADHVEPGDLDRTKKQMKQWATSALDTIKKYDR
jgi:uncharacterized protein (DUF2235 family)